VTENTRGKSKPQL